MLYTLPQITDLICREEEYESRLSDFKTLRLTLISEDSGIIKGCKKSKLAAFSEISRV